MEEYKDINGEVILLGDQVYYARKRDYEANGILTKERVTKISKKGVHMGRYIATRPSSQILKNDRREA